MLRVCLMPLGNSSWQRRSVSIICALSGAMQRLASQVMGSAYAATPSAVQDQLVAGAGLQRQLEQSEQALAEARRVSAEVRLPHGTAILQNRQALLHPRQLQ